MESGSTVHDAGPTCSYQSIDALPVTESGSNVDDAGPSCSYQSIDALPVTESGSNVHEAGRSCSSESDINTTTRNDTTQKKRIFLSHAGAQKDFVGWLYTHLSILYTSDCIFFDKEMPMGGNFVKNIFQAVEQCELAIVVMSPDYFESKWPMIELAAFVEAQKQSKKLDIFPLYYKLTVEKFQEKKLRDNWRKAWKEMIIAHPKHLHGKRLDCWEEALKTLSSTVNGCKMGDKSEEEYIEEIMKQACKLVAPSLPYDTSRVQGLKRLEAQFKEKFKCLDPNVPVSFFGMYGISGTGKTKMSQLLCNQMSREFLGKVCHVELDSDPRMNWRSKLLELLCTWSTGKPTTQAAKDANKLLKQEIRKHRLFLVLDNVQTGVTSVSRAFVELCWELEFKAGSVVLITSACSGDILCRTFHYIEWKKVFPVPTLQKEEAACLLAQSAGYPLSTRKDSQERMYVTKFVERCFLGFKTNDRQYHPRALEVLGTYIGHRIISNTYCKDICQWGEKIMFCILKKECDMLLDQNITSSNKTMYFDIILCLRRDTRFSSRILRTQEDFCEWYAFTFSKTVEEITAAIYYMQMQALFVIEDCRNYWGMGNRPCHRFLIHDLYREVATLNAKKENHSDNCVLYETGDGQFDQKSRINVQNNAEISSLVKKDLCNCSFEAKIMRVVSCSKITKLNLKGLDGLCSLEIRHCPNLREVYNVHHLRRLACLLWEGCAVEFPSLMGMTSLKLLIIEGGASNSPSMGRLSKLPRCLRLSKNSITKMEQPPNLRDCVHLQVLHLSRLQDLLEFPHLGRLRHLVKLEAASCPKVRSLGDLINLTSLKHLYLSNFESLEKIPDLGELIALKHLNVTKCPKVSAIPTLQNLTNLTHLCFDTLPIRQIPAIEHLVKLKHLNVTKCPKVSAIPTLQKFTNLTHLCLNTLPIEQIPGIERLVKLKQLRCRHSNLHSLPDLRLVTELDHLDVSYTPVSNLDRVGTLKKLKKLEAISCMNMDTLPCLPSFTKIDVTNSLYERLHNENFSRT